MGWYSDFGTTNIKVLMVNILFTSKAILFMLYFIFIYINFCYLPNLGGIFLWDEPVNNNRTKNKWKRETNQVGLRKEKQKATS